MPSVDEANQNQNPMAAALARGVGTVSQEQTVTFVRYLKVVLPTDGSVFWVKADQFRPGAEFNSFLLDTTPLNQSPLLQTPANTVTVKGSLHVSTDNQQDEDNGFALNRVTFTSLTNIDALDTVNPVTMYVGTFDFLPGLKFAFSRRSGLYKQAGLFHYQGDALYPYMATQLVDDARTLTLAGSVVSNSLPLWLMLTKYCPMYPSYLVPDNVTPPWCSVHIGPADTTALQSAPWIDPATGSHYQLATDRVRLTFYGLRNLRALDFQDYLLDMSANYDLFGILDMPIMRDDKSTQKEFNILAQKKVMEVVISYNQAQVRNTALQLIKSAFYHLYPEN